MKTQILEPPNPEISCITLGIEQYTKINKEPCNHDWETIDDSFSHEFGTEIIIYSRCKNCDAETQVGHAVNDDY